MKHESVLSIIDELEGVSRLYESIGVLLSIEFSLRKHTENGGIFVVKARHLLLVGAKGGDKRSEWGGGLRWSWEGVLVAVCSRSV